VNVVPTPGSLVTATLLRDAKDGGEAEPRALPLFLGREERLEDSRHGGAVHSRPRIRDREHDERPEHARRVPLHAALAELDVRRLDRELASGRHRVPRVHDEVHDDLFHRARIDAHEPDRDCRAHRQLDVLPEDPSQHPFHAREQAGEVDDLLLGDPLATEHEKPARELGGTNTGEVDLVDVVSHRVALAQIREKQLRVGQDD